MHTYFAFGLTIGSDIELPLSPNPSPGDRPTLRILTADLGGQTRALDNARHLWRLENGDVLCHVPMIATYRVVSTHTILIDQAPTASLASVQLYLLGSVMSVILHRLDGLILHGCAIQIGAKSLVCAGPSGIGKSTLALAFSQAGYSILTDDVALIRFGLDSLPHVIPSYPQMKLRRDTLEMLGLTGDGLVSVYNRADKYHLQIEGAFSASAVPLGAVYAVDTEDAASGVSIQPVGAAAAYPLIHNNTYRIEFLSDIGDTAQHFQACSRLLNHVPIRRLIRPTAGVDPHHMVSTILADFGTPVSHVTS